MNQNLTDYRIETLKDLKNSLPNLMDKLCNEVVRQLDDYIVEGLKRKGYEFKNQIELKDFIKVNCRCEDKTDMKQRIYFVKDIPFFLHCYEIEMLIPDKSKEGRIFVGYGSFKYL